MKALVTGTAGFIGSYMSERLLADGWEVTGIDSFDDFYEPQIKWRNIAGCLKNKNFRLVEADIRDRAAMDKAIQKLKMENAKSKTTHNAQRMTHDEIIVHLAARAGVRPSIEQPLLYADVNINGTMVLLEAARKHKVKKFIFGSSSSVYGNNKKVPFSEDDNVDFPVSPYAATKKAGELICHTYHHLYGICITCLRFFTVYGPRQRPDLAIHKFTRLIEEGKPIPIYGDGSMMRDFTFIDDIIDGTVAAMQRCEGYKIYNIGNANPISVNDLVTKIENALGKKAVKEYLPPQPGDVERTWADITRAARELGYKPKTTIEEGLAKFVEWLR
jgi:UDP-glucuronate 4-epimerase